MLNTHRVVSVIVVSAMVLMLTPTISAQGGWNGCGGHTYGCSGGGHPDSSSSGSSNSHRGGVGGGTTSAPVTHSANGDSVASMLNTRGNAFFKAGDYYAAADYYRVAIHRDPYNNLYISNYFIAIARIQYDDDELHNAVRSLRAAMQYRELDLGWQKVYSEWLAKESRVQKGQEVLAHGDGLCKAPDWCKGSHGEVLAWIWQQSPEEDLADFRTGHVYYQHEELRQYVIHR